MDRPPLRLYLSGNVVLEAGPVVVDSRAFPGQQGREAFCYLAIHRGLPVPRADLINAVWGADPPPSADTALNSIVSKLRSLLASAGYEGGQALRSASGCYQLVLPAGTWVDHEVAFESIHEAEAALSTHDPAAAYGPSAVAHHIARRPFLPGSPARWVEPRRTKLASVLVRSLECRAEVYIWNGESTLAVEAAREVVALSPFRESGYRALMRSHAAGGNRAEALQVYERCRMLFAEELGVAPSRETKRVHTEILHST